MGAGVVWIGVPSQRGGHGNGCGGRGVGIGLVWAGTTAAMPAINKSKQSITPKSRTLNFILGVSMRSMCSAERASILNLYHYQVLTHISIGAFLGTMARPSRIEYPFVLTPFVHCPRLLERSPTNAESLRSRARMWRGTRPGSHSGPRSRSS